jgi:electron transport complex protein RnfG
MLKFVSKNALLLSLAAVACVAVIAGVNQLTSDRIAEQAQAQKLKVLTEVLPADHQDDALLEHCLEVSAADAFGVAPSQLYRTQVNGQAVYVSETVAPDGYSGNISLLAAIRADGTVLGVRTIAHKETPGLGDKIEVKRHPWILSFAGKQVESVDDKRWAVKKDGGEFDQFTGATITPRAVVAAVKRAALYIKAHPELANQTAGCPAA